MRSTPTGNATLLKIQQEINEVAQRENELRTLHLNGSVPNGETNPRLLQRTVSTPSLNQNSTINSNGTTRRYIPNSNTKGVMQKFFKMRGKVNVVSAISHQDPPKSAWIPTEPVTTPPSKALIPNDKPLRKGYVPIQERIQSELQEIKKREEELRSERRKSQPDLMAALEAESEGDISRSPSPPVIGKLRPARSMSHLLDEEFPTEVSSAPSSLRPARSLAQLCDAADDEIESPRSLIQQWESRIQQSQREV